MATYYQQVGVVTGEGTTHDIAGNAPATRTGTDDFSVNTQSTPAHVTSATPSIWQINKLTLADAQPRFSVTVDYDQPMDPAYPPSITFSPNNISNLLDLPEPRCNSWNHDGTEYTEWFDVASTGPMVVPGVSIHVTGAYDLTVRPGELEGYEQARYDGPESFSVDTQSDPPDRAAVAFVDSNISLITDAATTVENQPGFWVGVDFTEPMRYAAIPQLTFSPDLTATPNPTLVPNHAFWINDHYYVAWYDVQDEQVPLTNVTVSVSGACDPNGDLQAPYVGATPLFSVDTLDPPPPVSYVAYLTPQTTTITTANYTSGFNLGVTYEFTEPMDIRVSPTIAMKVGDDPLPEGTLAYSTGYWATSRTYYGFYVLDAAPDTYVPSVDVEVSGAVDATGQTQTTRTFGNVFTIDTSAAGPASVVGVTRSTWVIRDADAGSATFSLTIQYDTDMDTASTPTIDYDADTLDDKTVVEGVVTPDAASHWMENDDTRYVAVFDVADVGEYVGWTNVTVAGALDAAHDHRQYRFEGSGFRIDMVLPANLAASGASTDEIDLTWNRYSPERRRLSSSSGARTGTDWTPLTAPTPP